MSRILIAGAGYVGSALAARLAASGHEVTTLRRSATPGPRAIAADLSDAAALRPYRARFDALVYTAGADETSEEAYRRAYVVGLENALDAFDAERVVLTSSTAVYAQTNGEWVDETSPTEASHFSGRVLLEAEHRLALRRPDAVVLRFGGIYGPGRASMLAALQRGEASYVEADDSNVNRIHRDDCAGALAHLLAVPEPERLYLVVDDEPCPRRVVLEWLASELGLTPPRSVPPSERPTRRAQSNKRCKNTRLVASGYSLCYPTFREGYAAVAARDLRTSRTRPRCPGR